ncbi:phosphoenolpyruvate--protein phosphotransferase [Pseudonocardia sp.]|uniref:phosphoenolpyruvate--protein phosphotransferase n=1 Tax=Pseudonocardia sp. TaxID=60912 RepID=UPI0031FD9C08
MTPGPVGLVVVAHSRRLAQAAVGLAREMAGPDVAIEVAAGLDETTFGTDAMAIASALGEADRGAGVVVLMDLGSAVLSAELALDLLDDADLRDRVLLCPAPLVEGLVVAAVTAAGGADAATVAAEAGAALAAKEAQLGGAPPEPAALPTVTPDEPVTVEAFTVVNPHGLHARPAARLVGTARSAGEDTHLRLRNATTGSDWAPATSLSRVAALGVRQGDRVEAAADGPGARAALDALLALAARGFDEEVDDAPPQVPETPGPMPAVPGTAVGPAWTPRAARPAVPDDPAGEPAAERAALGRARTAVREEITRSRAAAPAQAGIFDAHALLLDDLLTEAYAGVDGGESAARAWAAAADRNAAALRALPDAYQAARAADVEAVGEQVLRVLVGASALPEPPPGQRVVLVAPDLTPAAAAALDADHVAGVALEGGSPTAHSAVLLRARGIPAVVGTGPLGVADRVVVALDGGRGEVVVDPAPEVRAAYEERAAAEAARRSAAAARASAPAETADGTPVLVGVNVGADPMPAPGADLAGLVRTEFLFLGRDTAPGVDEQVAAYRAVAEALGGRRITLRTLDVGGDKPLPYLPTPTEANPFLGVRGLRLALATPGLLADQLLAAVRVAHETPVSVMFPMVSTLPEVQAALAALDDAIAREGRGRPAELQVGIMVEVPAAALKARVLARHLDFLSIGTNDLTQYALAAERGNPAVAALADPLDPGVLRLVDAVCRGAGDRALVAVCGESAADEAAVPLLVGLGVRELSVAAPAVAVVKDAVRAVHLPTARALAAAALDADGAPEVRALVADAR